MATITVTLATAAQTITSVMNLSDTDADNILAAYGSTMPNGSTPQQINDTIVSGMCSELAGFTQQYLQQQAAADAEHSISAPAITPAA
jgi:hypothetical protein